MDKPDAIGEYWRAREAALGEKISYKTIAQMYRGGEPERLGLLFLTDRHLLFEYRLNPRRGILDAIFRKGGSQADEQTLKIPRSELKRVGLISPSTARRWARRNPPPAEIRVRIPDRSPAALAALLFGTWLMICTEDSYLAFNTPENREWLKRLT